MCTFIMHNVTWRQNIISIPPPPSTGQIPYYATSADWNTSTYTERNLYIIIILLVFNITYLVFTSISIVEPHYSPIFNVCLIQIYIVDINIPMPCYLAIIIGYTFLLDKLLTV